jgi:hypothetical protein
MTIFIVFSTARICITGRPAASRCAGVHAAIEGMSNAASGGLLLQSRGKV